VTDADQKMLAANLQNEIAGAEREI